MRCGARTHDLRLERLALRGLGQRAHDAQRLGELLEAVEGVGALELEVALALRELQHLLEAAWQRETTEDAGRTRRAGIRTQVN